MILKFLEEPAENVIAMFITTNIDSVLSTIKSRCQIINLFYDSEINYEEENIRIIDDFLNQNKFISIFDSKNYFKKYDRNQIIDLLDNYLNYLLSSDLSDNNFRLIKKLNKVLNFLNNNVNVDYAFDVLFLEGDLKKMAKHIILML